VRVAGLGQHFSFSVGGEFNPGKVEKQHLLALAESLGIAPKYLLKIASETIARMLVAVPLAVAEVLPHLSNSEQVLTQHLELDYIRVRPRYFAMKTVVCPLFSQSTAPARIPRPPAHVNCK
jgi:hypothetical protein